MIFFVLARAGTGTVYRDPGQEIRISSPPEAQGQSPRHSQIISHPQSSKQSRQRRTNQVEQRTYFGTSPSRGADSIEPTVITKGRCHVKQFLVYLPGNLGKWKWFVWCLFGKIYFVLFPARHPCNRGTHLQWPSGVRS